MVSKLDLYKIFWVVGKNESFSKAAKELFLTQPAVSQAIHQLENELETRLFNRTPKGVTLTDEGSHLFEYVQSALNLLETGEEKIAAFKHLTTGELKVGVSDTISRYFLLPYLEVFHNAYPGVKFKIVNGTTDETIAMLKNGKVDMAICNFPIKDTALELRPFIHVHDIFVYGEKFRKILSGTVSLQKLVKLPLIFWNPRRIRADLWRHSCFQRELKQCRNLSLVRMICYWSLPKSIWVLPV
ncbi:LysR family transcriptional regulator [Virgibacillus sp. 179-BFC.A HS]|uniref:LysR family transcriptional regulator n=1 Tax=Tigheibacillus jepli TaxID=3035914 RepID=A0ABU5CD97_9BACI|nr:LysR family transcriptional regulator [Virgibacillus sp. 179-BFC.A HS]MDY0404312.1 LysR family transcriptional regulator [Virgibacillus sp. 179-BFC.A HS]